MPISASDKPIRPMIEKFKRFFIKVLTRDTEFAFERMTETGDVLCATIFSQLVAFLALFEGFVKDVNPSKVLADLATAYQIKKLADLNHTVKQKMYNSYEFLCQDLLEIKKAAKEIKGCNQIRYYTLQVCMYAEMALINVQEFFEGNWQGDEAERDEYMSETHQRVKLIVEHIQFLCDRHTASLPAKEEEKDARPAEDGIAEDGRVAKRQRLGTPPSEPPAGSVQ